MIKKLTIEKLRLLASAGAVRELRLVGQGGGFILMVATRDDEGPLTTALGDERVFSKIDTVARLVHELGIGCMTLDLAKWQPGQKVI
jgi:hypothetical protein